MANSIDVSKQAHLDPHQLQRHNNESLEKLAEKTVKNATSPEIEQDTVTLNSEQQEKSVTYSNVLTIQTGEDQDKYNMLRGLVANMLKEQGIELKVTAGDKEINLNEITQEEAVELIDEDGYFGVDQTSDRIVDFAIGISGNDPSRLDAIKEGVENGFNEALEAFGGWLPDISYDTYDAVMSKLDAWADVDSTEQAS